MVLTAAPQSAPQALKSHQMLFPLLVTKGYKPSSHKRNSVVPQEAAVLTARPQRVLIIALQSIQMLSLQLGAMKHEPTSCMWEISAQPEALTVPAAKGARESHQLTYCSGLKYSRLLWLCRGEL